MRNCLVKKKKSSNLTIGSLLVGIVIAKNILFAYIVSLNKYSGIIY